MYWKWQAIFFAVCCILRKTPLAREARMGRWCSGITPAQHAGGPGCNPQSVHLFLAQCAVIPPK